MHSLADFRALIRATLELTDADLPDLLTDEWLRDASERCQSARQAWPFYETTWTVDTVDGVDTLTLADITVGSGTEIAEIRQIRGQSWELKWQDISERDATAPQNSAHPGAPTHYSQWSNGDVTLFPTPNVVEALMVRGYRKPTDWVTPSDGGATSDMPVEFDRPILNWALGRAYAHQDEPQSAIYYADMANGRLNELIKRYNDIPPAVDLIMNGGNRRAAFTDPRIPWE